MNMLTGFLENGFLENALILTLLSMAAALVVVFVLNRFFVRQTERQWLGLTYGSQGWRQISANIPFHFNYKRKDVELSFIRAGIYNTRLAGWYFPAKIVIAVLLFAIVFIFGEQLGIVDQVRQIAYAFVGMVAIILMPDMWLHHRQKKRIRKVSAELPYVCDLMAVCVQTGMTIESSITYLSEELKSFDQDLAYVMKRADSVARVSGMNAALEEMAEQYPTNQVRSFVYTLSQSLQYGNSVFEVLTRLSSNLREIEMLELEEKVGKLSAKMSVPLILFIMFPIVILITAPGIMRMMSNG